MATKKGSVISNYIKALIETNQQTLGIDKVFYGDQRILSDGTVVCIEPTKKIVDPPTVGYQVVVRMETGIIVYRTGDIGNELVQEEADELLEAIENVINIDASPSSLGFGGTQLGGNISSGWCSTAEHGYRIPSSQITRANRLLFSSMSKVNLIES